MSPITVMLVDDQELFRQATAFVLDAQDGLEVVAQGADGAQALDLVRRTHPDVVLMDIRMPEVDGVEATRQILAWCAAHDVDPPRIIVLTTFRLDDRAAEAIRLGASGFLLKECTPQQLIDAVRTVHGGSAVFAPDDLAILLGMAAPPPSAVEVPVEFDQLTDREREVFGAVARGLSNTEIASHIFAGESTVKTHVGAILRKLSLRDRVQIVVFAYDHGLVGRSR